jgi:hypothetical protein
LEEIASISGIVVINPLGSWFSYHFLLQTMKISGPILWYRRSTYQRSKFTHVNNPVSQAKHASSMSAD